MKWSYTVNDSGYIRVSSEIDLDDTTAPEVAMTIVRGYMFEDSWSPDTPYVIERFDEGDSVAPNWRVVYASWNWRDNEEN